MAEQTLVEKVLSQGEKSRVAKTAKVVGSFFGQEPTEVKERKSVGVGCRVGKVWIGEGRGDSVLAAETASTEDYKFNQDKHGLRIWIPEGMLTETSNGLHQVNGNKAKVLNKQLKIPVTGGKQAIEILEALHVGPDENKEENEE